MRAFLPAALLAALVSTAAFAGDPARVRSYIDDAKGYVENSPESALDYLKRAEEAMEGLDDGVKAPFLKEIADLKKAAIHSKTANELNRLGQSLGRIVEGILKGEDKNWSEGQVENGLKNVEEQVGQLPQDDPDVKKFVERIKKDRADFKAYVAKAERDEVAGRAVEFWKYLEKNYGQECEGWKSETKAPTVADIIKSQPYQIGYAKTIKALQDLAGRFFENDQVKKAIEKYPNDAEFKQCLDAATEIRDKGSAQLASIAGSLLDEMEKQGDSEKTKYLFDEIKRDVEYHTKGSPAHDKTLARIAAIEKKWADEKAANAAKKEGLKKKLIETANAVWPDYQKHYDFVKIDPLDATENPGNWKGKVIHFHTDSGDMNRSGGDYADSFHFICEVNGMPVACNFDSGLSETWNELTKATGEEPDWSGYNDIVAVVEAVGAVQRQEQIGNNKYAVGNPVKCPVARIVAFRTQNGFAAACGYGTNLEKIDGMPKVTCEESGSSSGGGHGGGSSGGKGFFGWYFSGSDRNADGFLWHMIKRLLSWFAAFVTVLGGLFAVAYGGSRFVPQLDEQLKKLGDYVGYIGLGLAGFAFFWLVVTLILWDLLPAGALFAVGAFVGGVETLKRKEKLTAETASMIQPVAVAFGLGAMGLGALHVLLWDCILL